ncbi:MAG TPA: hypothetical protein PLK99_02350, partial [Burkholderiales bacterium]|nr:hypothetical protein [Burkholderiales bacterium]
MIEAADGPSGFLEYECAGGIIPQFLSAVQINVDPARCRIAPFQGAGAEIPLRGIRRGEREAACQILFQPLEIDCCDGSPDGSGSCP